MRIAKANALRWKFDSAMILHLDADLRLGVDLMRFFVPQIRFDDMSHFPSCDLRTFDAASP